MSLLEGLLLHQVCGNYEPVNSRTVDAHSRRWRANLEVDPAEPLLLQTVRGFGYRLSAS